MKKPSEVLRAARELITDRFSWTTGTYARNKNSAPVSSRRDDAVCWCASGAINASDDCDLSLGYHAKKALEDVMGCPISQFNDTSTHAMVLNAFDNAIQLAEARGE